MLDKFARRAEATASRVIEGEAVVVMPEEAMV
ncbi:unnamed protein product, partial [marine sediment metagenome]